MFSILNGDEVNIDNKFVNLLLYGYGVYTSFIVADGKVRYWNAHLDRVTNDAKQFLDLDVSKKDVVSSVEEFINKIYKGNPISCRVTIFAEDFNLTNPQLLNKISIMVTGKEGGGTVTLTSVRLKMFHCARSNTQYKVTNNIAAQAKIRANAKKLGFNDALICNDNLISEGSTWNIFFIKENTVYTPSLDSEILPGITRKICIDYFKDKIVERKILKSELKDFDAAFITNSAIAAVPVSEIDGIYYDINNKLLVELQDYYINMYQETITL